MAETLAIIGLASNIISFIDFGLKLFSGIGIVRDSLHGTTPEIRELDLIVEDVQRLNAGVIGQKSTGQTLSKDELRISATANECENVATEIRKVIKDLRVRQDARSKTLESGRVVIQGLWKRGDIERLRGRLESLDQRIRLNIKYALDEGRNSAIMSRLKTIEKSHHTMSINYELKLDLIRDEILRLASNHQGNGELLATTKAAQLTSLKSKLDTLEKEHLICDKQSKVIESLYFPELRRRWSQIPEANQATNAWLFDPKLTSFMHWLEIQDGIYWITGKAGSGKSTLMKFASEHENTLRTLKKWASPAGFYTASYYFWNQGFEMQKSQLGLFQSLLYQILRRAPSLIPYVCPDRSTHEVWDIAELKKTFELIAKQEVSDTKFCFFIDGLDEYDGEEDEIVDMIKFLSSSRNIKICASSRFRSIFEESFGDLNRRLIIHNFTNGDMRKYVRQRLDENSKFRDLKASDPACEEIETSISTRAQGVWLWVFLVSRDLMHAVNRNEGLAMLQKIVRQFPSDLKTYFERIVHGIKPEYREEMARIFLITIDQVQPLPLFAFSLLERENTDTDYAVKAPIRPITDKILSVTHQTWKSRIQNRCGDLLVVEDEPHPTSTGPVVDFLHRTVRDFLQDTYYDQLKKELISDFNSMDSLTKMMLYLLKSLPVFDFRDKSSINALISLTDELLYYAHEVEKRSQSPESSLVDILDEVDKVNTYHARSLSNHWTHARDSPRDGPYNNYREGGNCNFLALTVQARLVKYVRVKLEADPRCMMKNGRPLLDYALRPKRRTPIVMPYHSRRDEPSVDINMVQLLLNNGADPNKKLHLNDDRTVWAQFLLSCQTSIHAENITPTLEDAWYQASEMLIQHDARYSHWLGRNRGELIMSQNLDIVFGEAKAAKLMRMMEENEKQKQQTNSLCVVS